MKIIIRSAKSSEFLEIGQLMVDVYSRLDGFPRPKDHPDYYSKLKNVGLLTENESVELLVATTEEDKILGAVVFYNDLQFYGSAGTITKIQNASGFRLLAVDPKGRGNGIGKKLCMTCLTKARQNGYKHLYIHSTKSMHVAWSMYERIGFYRYEEIDFSKPGLEVFGFRIDL